MLRRCVTDLKFVNQSAASFPPFYSRMLFYAATLTIDGVTASSVTISIVTVRDVSVKICIVTVTYTSGTICSVTMMDTSGTICIVTVTDASVPVVFSDSLKCDNVATCR